MATAKKFEVEVTVPEGKVAGDVFTIEVEAPEVPKQSRGQLGGLTLTEMTDDQLKREIINASSVLYKAKQRGAEATTVTANEVRLEAAKAEKASRAPIVAEVAAETPAEEGTPAEETPVVEGSKGKKKNKEVDASVASEI